MPGNPFKNRTEAPTPERAVKVKTFRCTSLREAVATLPCMHCGKEGRTQAAHCNEGKGKSIKSTDASLFAVCVECHADIDQPGSKARAKADRRALETALNLKTLRALVEQGVLRLAK